MGNQGAMGRKSESLRKFSGQAGDFINRSEHFMDHMARVHQVWRPTLVWMSKTEEPLTMHRLRNDTIGSYNENAGDLALKLEHKNIDWMPESLYKKPVQLAESPGETGNGFAVWRRLFRDNKGSRDVVEYAGIDLFFVTTLGATSCQSCPHISTAGMSLWTTMAQISHKLHAH